MRSSGQGSRHESLGPFGSSAPRTHATTPCARPRREQVVRYDELTLPALPARPPAAGEKEREEQEGRAGQGEQQARHASGPTDGQRGAQRGAQRLSRQEELALLRRRRVPLPGLPSLPCPLLASPSRPSRSAAALSRPHPLQQLPLVRRSPALGAARSRGSPSSHRPWPSPRAPHRSSAPRWAAASPARRWVGAAPRVPRKAPDWQTGCLPRRAAPPALQARRLALAAEGAAPARPASEARRRRSSPARRR